MSQLPTYDDVYNLARQIRRKILKAVAYDVVQRALKGLQSTIEGAIFEAPTRLILDPGRYNPDTGLRIHQPMPPITFVIKDPTTDEIYADLGVRADVPFAPVIDPDAVLDTYRRSRLATFQALRAFVAYVYHPGGHVQVELRYYDRIAADIFVDTSMVETFVHPDGRDPKVETTATGATRYHLHAAGAWYYGEAYLDDTLVASVLLAICDFLGYYDVNDKLVGDRGYYVVLTNHDDANAIDVEVPGVIAERLQPSQQRWRYVTSLWVMTAVA